MSRGQRVHLRPQVGPTPRRAQELELPSTRVHVTAGRDERLGQERDEPLSRGRGRIEVPGADVRILQDQPASWSGKAEIALELLLPTSKRRDLEPAVHEVEYVRLEAAIE